MGIELRAWRFDDAESLRENADNPRVAARLRDVFPSPYRLEDARRYIRSCIDASQARQLVCAIAVDGKAVGSAGLFRQEDIRCKTAELGYWLGESYWGRGIATAAAWALCAKGFARYDIERIEAVVFADNDASRKALAKNGFLLEGTMRKSVYKNGVLRDCCIYALLREDFEQIQARRTGLGQETAMDVIINY